MSHSKMTVAERREHVGLLFKPTQVYTHQHFCKLLVFNSLTSVNIVSNKKCFHLMWLKTAAEFL